MKAAALVLLFAGAAAAGVSPVQQVLSMLGEMQGKAVKLMEEEQSMFEKYEEWVDDEERRIGYELKTTNSKIEKAQAAIATADTCVQERRSEISQLDDDIAENEADKKEAIAARAAEHQKFLSVEADVTESVDALKMAISDIMSGAHDSAAADAEEGKDPEAVLLNMAATSPGLRRAAAALIEMRSRSKQEDPKAQAYEVQAGGVLDTLKKLQEKFEKQLNEVQNEEQNEINSHEMAMLHITDTLKVSKRDREERTLSQAKCAGESSRVNGELKGLQADKEEDEKIVADLKAVFAVKKDAFDQNQIVRQDELKALKKAEEIIASPEVSGFLSKTVSPAQAAKPQTFLQVHQKSQRAAVFQKVAKFLKNRAAVLSSSALAKVAAGVEQNPLMKVIGMIDDMLSKLKEEAQEEATHKAYCDKELKENKLTRNGFQSDVDKLNAEIEEKVALIQSYADQIATFSREQAELTKAMEDATNQRQTEKAKNAEKLGDATKGEAAVKKALVVLREFYAKQSSFVQTSTKQAPEIASYGGMGGATGGVVGMLEVIESDFARIKSETSAAEGQAQREYEEFVADAEQAKHDKHRAEVKMSRERDQFEFDRSLLVKDLRSVEKELSKANEYFQSLKPMCTTVHVSYEERAAKRKEEIDSLKKAYEMLDQKAL